MKRLLIIVPLLLSLSCGRGPAGVDDQASGEQIKVVATTTFVADLAREIGEPFVEITGLMGPGVDPHLFKPSAGDVRRMAAARAVLSNGLHLEGKTGEVLAEMDRRGVTSVAVAECVDPERLIAAAGFSGAHDPHIWFDVALWAQAADCVRHALQELVPDHAAELADNAARYRARLDELDAWVRSRISSLPEERRILITAHDAFGYLGRAYGLEVRGLLGVSTAAEAGAADVEALADYIVKHRVPAIFVETSVSPRYVEALQEAAAAKGHEVRIGGSLYSDALGDPDGPAGDYIGTVRHNVSTIVDALSGSEPEPGSQGLDR